MVPADCWLAPSRHLQNISADQGRFIFGHLDKFSSQVFSQQPEPFANGTSRDFGELCKRHLLDKDFLHPEGLPPSRSIVEILSHYGKEEIKSAEETLSEILTFVAANNGPNFRRGIVEKEIERLLGISFSYDAVWAREGLQWATVRRFIKYFSSLYEINHAANFGVTASLSPDNMPLVQMAQTVWDAGGARPSAQLSVELMPKIDFGKFSGRIISEFRSHDDGRMFARAVDLRGSLTAASSIHAFQDFSDFVRTEYEPYLLRVAPEIQARTVFQAPAEFLRTAEERIVKAEHGLLLAATIGGSGLAWLFDPHAPLERMLEYATLFAATSAWGGQALIQGVGNFIHQVVAEDFVQKRAFLKLQRDTAMLLTARSFATQ